jgi:alpha-ketoglutarate-dependent taurine dioxygenase
MAVVIDGLTQVSIPEQKQLEDGSGAFPLTLSPCDGATMTASQLGDWTQKHTMKLRELAMRHGAVLLRGCKVRGAEDFAAMVGATDCEGYDYIGGAAPRTELVPGLVFTSNESPPDQPIPFHHELAQAPTPPSYILFHCETESAEGGATPIIHSAEVAKFFEAAYPEFASRVAAQGVRYIRVMPEVTDPTSAQGRSWRETYNVQTREEAEAAMRKQGTSFEWLANGDCRTTTATLPALRVDQRTGKRVFFNSMIAAFIGWNDSRNVGEKAVVLGDGSPVDPEAMRGVADFMHERRVTFRWHQGDILFIDNSLVMHGRDSFVPPRRVLAALRGLPLASTAARPSKSVAQVTQAPQVYSRL